MDNSVNEKIALVHASLHLTDLGTNFNTHSKTLSKVGQSKKANLDEELAYQFVEELEDWKTKQQEMFLVDLKRREINHLANLSAEWQKRRCELESTLASKLDQCHLLTAALEEAHRSVKVNNL